MQIEFAFFANAVEVQSNGFMYVLGGGYDTIQAKSFPGIFKGMNVIVRLLTQPNEWGQQHQLLSEIIRPSGDIMGNTEVKIPFMAIAHPRHPDRVNRMTIRITYEELILPEPGDYTFQFSVDGVQIGSTVLEVVQILEN